MTAAMGVLLATTSDPKSPDLLSPALKGVFHAALAIWPVWLLIGLVAFGKVAYQLYRVRRLSKSGIGEIDEMDGKTFETFLGTLFRSLGYSVEITRYRGDYGADLIVTKGAKRTSVQAKRWSKRVGLSAVQEAVAAKGYYGCEAALVVANREFTQPARRLARANKVELWDREELVKKLLAVGGQAEPVELAPQILTPPGASRESASPAPLVSANEVAVALAVEAVVVEPARCVACDVAVSDKVRDYCVAHSARFGGDIYCFAHQRTKAARARSAVQPEQIIGALRIANEGRPTQEGKSA